VGYSNISPDPNSPVHAFVFAEGSMRDLGTLGGDNSVATGINDSGQVVGYSETSTGSDSPIHAFVFADGAMRDLGTLSGINSVATGINNSGQPSPSRQRLH
jgi:probable HAF family extracellular repeat protein